MVAGFPKKGGTGGNHAVLPADREKKNKVNHLGRKEISYPIGRETLES